jgi:hypothetical protein
MLQTLLLPLTLSSATMTLWSCLEAVGLAGVHRVGLARMLVAGVDSVHPWPAPTSRPDSKTRSSRQRGLATGERHCCRLQGHVGLYGVDIPCRLEPRRPGGRLAVSAECPQTQGAQLQGVADVMLRQILCSPLTLAIAWRCWCCPPAILSKLPCRLTASRSSGSDWWPVLQQSMDSLRRGSSGGSGGRPGSERRPKKQRSMRELQADGRCHSSASKTLKQFVVAAPRSSELCGAAGRRSAERSETLDPSIGPWRRCRTHLEASHMCMPSA